MKVRDIKAAIKDLPDDQEVLIYTGVSEIGRSRKGGTYYVAPVRRVFPATAIEKGLVSIQPIEGLSSVLVILPAEEIGP